jgi:hypothetical protein
VSKDLVDGYTAHDDKDTLQKRLKTLPPGLRPLFDRFFSSIDRYHREFLLSIFHMLKVHQGIIDVALATAYLHHKSVTSQQDFFRRCDEVQSQTVSRSKGLIEVDYEYFYNVATGVRGLALVDLSTQTPLQSVLEDADFRSWLRYKHVRFRWLHRSAYDYISGDLEADSPAWAQGADTSLDMLSGCVWLHRYGLSVWTYSARSDTDLRSDVRSCADIIISVVQSGGEVSPDDGYKALDNILPCLSSLYSDRWIQLYPKGQSRISCPMVHYDHKVFWITLMLAGFTDYVIFRFEWLKRSICAHCVSFGLLALSYEQLGDTLAALVLDYLISETHADTAVTNAPLSDWYEYRVAEINDSGGTMSWLSHGKCDEDEVMRSLHKLVSHEIASQSISSSITSKIYHLSDLWQLSCQSRPVKQRDNYWNILPFQGNITPLQVYTNVSHHPNRSNSTTESKSRLRLRFIGLRKAIVLNAICMFDLSHASNEMLRNYHLARHGAIDTHRAFDSTSSAEGNREARALHNVFEGTAAGFERCLDGVLEDIWADGRCQLDSWQQLYLLTCVKLYFKTLWRIDSEPPCDVQEVSEADRGESSHTSELCETGDRSF